MRPSSPFLAFLFFAALCLPSTLLAQETELPQKELKTPVQVPLETLPQKDVKLEGPLTVEGPTLGKPLEQEEPVFEVFLELPITPPVTSGEAITVPAQPVQLKTPVLLDLGQPVNLIAKQPVQSDLDLSQTQGLVKAPTVVKLQMAGGSLKLPGNLTIKKLPENTILQLPEGAVLKADMKDMVLDLGEGKLGMLQEYQPAALPEIQLPPEVVVTEPEIQLPPEVVVTEPEIQLPPEVVTPTQVGIAEPEASPAEALETPVKSFTYTLNDMGLNVKDLVELKKTEAGLEVTFSKVTREGSEQVAQGTLTPAEAKQVSGELLELAAIESLPQPIGKKRELFQIELQGEDPKELICPEDLYGYRNSKVVRACKDTMGQIRARLLQGSDPVVVVDEEDEGLPTEPPVALQRKVRVLAYTLENAKDRSHESISVVAGFGREAGTYRVAVTRVNSRELCPLGRGELTAAEVDSLLNKLVPQAKLNEIESVPGAKANERERFVLQVEGRANKQLLVPSAGEYGEFAERLKPLKDELLKIRARLVGDTDHEDDDTDTEPQGTELTMRTILQKRRGGPHQAKTVVLRSQQDVRPFFSPRGEAFPRHLPGVAFHHSNANPQIALAVATGPIADDVAKVEITKVVRNEGGETTVFWRKLAAEQPTGGGDEDSFPADSHQDVSTGDTIHPYVIVAIQALPEGEKIRFEELPFEKPAVATAPTGEPEAGSEKAIPGGMDAPLEELKQVLKGGER